jgi:transcriptional antiterminator RfaH
MTAETRFPRYLFARADLDAVGLWSLHYVPGSVNVVMLGDVPARIGDEVISALRERLPHLNVLDDRGGILEAGDRVGVTSGPLAGLEAVFDQRFRMMGEPECWSNYSGARHESWTAC